MRNDEGYHVAVEGPDAWQMLYTDAGEFPLADHYVELCRQAGIRIAMVGGHDPEEIASYGERCHGLFLFRARVDDALLAALPRCRILARIGVGYDLIDVEAARRRGVMVTYVPDFCTEELAEHTMAFILGFARRFPQVLYRARDHRWLSAREVPPMRRLVGQSLGILGFGRSGQRTAELARAFGMAVRVWTRTPRPEVVARVGARSATFEEVLGCDYVSLHLPLTDATRGLIDRAALALFKPHAVLINIARGAIVDTDALVDALREGRLAGAGLDVVTPAPLPPEHPLWSFPTVWITSHSGAFSLEAGEEALSTVFEDVLRVHSGRPPLHPVPELQGGQ
jgi:D-3-phosphoglycerate dehydrogenase